MGISNAFPVEIENVKLLEALAIIINETSKWKDD